MEAAICSNVTMAFSCAILKMMGVYVAFTASEGL